MRSSWIAQIRSESPVRVQSTLEKYLEIDTSRLGQYNS